MQYFIIQLVEYKGLYLYMLVKGLEVYSKQLERGQEKSMRWGVVLKGLLVCDAIINLY